MTLLRLFVVCVLSTLVLCSEMHDTHPLHKKHANPSQPHKHIARNHLHRLSKRKKMLASVLPYSPASPLITSPLIFDKYAKSSAHYQSNVFPHLTAPSGAWEMETADWWTSGFYPGTLYLLHERKTFCTSSSAAVGRNGADVDWLTRARQWSNGLGPLQKKNTVGHDTGFLAYPYVSELEINPSNQTALEGVRAFAQLLADRFSSVVGCTRSWESNAPNFLVIMDNMMNLELLYLAGRLFNLPHYFDIANAHATTTSKHHLRPDASSYHVVNYDENTGAVTRRYTAQGFADWSTWSRGQAWGLYGFASMYNLTQNALYLHTARAMGQRWLTRLAEDPSGIPKWDFDAPEPASKDTSAAAIASTGFLYLYHAELSTSNYTGAAFWRDSALTVLSRTADRYFQQSPQWDAILSNGTSNHPSGKVDSGIVYGDYYFVKAGNMLLNLGLASC